MSRRSPALVGAVVAASFVLTGCNGGSSTPKTPQAELSASLDNLTDSDVLTTTVALAGDPSALQAFVRAQGARLSATDARSVTSARLVVEAKSSDGKLSDGKATNVAISGSSGGRTFVEVRVVHGDVYLRGDVRGVLALAHKRNLYGEVKARAASLPDFVRAFVAGRWVSLAGAAAQGLVGTFAGVPSGGDSGAGVQITRDLKKVLDRDVTVRKVGTDAQGDHLALSGHARKLVTDLLQVIGGDLPGGSLAATKIHPSQVPDRLVTIDAWVNDGDLRQISIDLGQFGDAGAATTHLPLTLTFDKSGGDITAPSAATPIDLTRLSTLMGALSK